MVNTNVGSITMTYSKDTVIAFCLCSPALAGIAALPSIFSKWWMQNIAYPCTIISMFLLIGTFVYFLLAKKRCIGTIADKHHLQNTFYEIGHIHFSSNIVFISHIIDEFSSESLFIHQQAKKIFLKINECGEFIYLQLTHDNAPAHFDILSDNISIIDVVVDNGTFF